MASLRYLTKSRFKLALECPTKLYYTGKTEYANQSLDDAFLQALADGGYQVGELAKHYFPGGETIKTLDTEEALAQTNSFLKRDHVIIYDAAICYQQLLIRVDILVKRPDHIQLIEVKAKSYKKSEDNNFLNTKGKVVPAWKPYLMDIAFQKYVTQKALPDYSVSSYLMLTDKEAVCATNGLNQKFKLIKDGSGGVRVISNLSAEDIATPLLTKLNVDHILNDWLISDAIEDLSFRSFTQAINDFSDAYTTDRRIEQTIGSHCKKCEFTCSPSDTQQKLKSGFNECWQRQLGLSNIKLTEPTVLSLWNNKKTDSFIKAGIIYLKDLTPDDLKTDGKFSSPLSQSERQWLQVSKVKTKDTSAYIDKIGMRQELATHQYPLHFIDFESCTSAIPYFKGMSPYETIAFQFSHHVLQQDGRVVHRTQFINTEPGSFPNFEFVRALKKALSQDNGSIFRFASHENTVLNHIAKQLTDSEEQDREELVAFIQTITYSGEKNSRIYGPRCMVDLCELVKQYYYDPATQGSNSIKALLPAILNSSSSLQTLYGKANYGSSEFTSLNFQNHCWLAKVDGKVIDPYKQLPKLFADASEHDIELLSEQDELNNGGLALTAYGKLQFTEMSDYERRSLENALLKYCELDTLAMVMIYQGWQAMLDNPVMAKS